MDNMQVNSMTSLVQYKMRRQLTKSSYIFNFRRNHVYVLKMQTNNPIVTHRKNDTIMIEEENGQRYIWKMPNSSWHNFIFNNIRFEVQITRTVNGTPLIRFRDVECDRFILQEPLRPAI